MPNSRGSWPSLPQSTLKSFFLWTKGPPGVKLCCHTKVPSHSGQDTRPYPDVSSWPLRPSNLPTAAHRELCDWAMHNCSYPGGPTSLPCPLLYSVRLPSQLLHTLFQGAGLPCPHPSLPLPLLSSGSHRLAITEGPFRPREI